MPPRLADPKVASQLFRGIREGCNVSGHVCRIEQHRYFSRILDMAPCPGKFLERAVARGGWVLEEGHAGTLLHSHRGDHCVAERKYKCCQQFYQQSKEAQQEDKEPPV